MISNMDPTVTIQGTKLRGMTPKPMRVAWRSNGDVVVCCIMNVGIRVLNTGSKTQLQPSVKKESVQMVAHRPKSNL